MALYSSLRPFLAPCLFLLLAGCGGPDAASLADREKFTLPDSLLRSLQVDTVRSCRLVDEINLTGMVDFNQDNQVNIYPLVSGIIQDVRVQLGDFVKQGQVLAVVKSSEMAQLSHDLVAARTNLLLTAKNLEAARDLFKSGLNSQLDVNAAQTNYEQAQAELDRVNRVLKINGGQPEGDYIIKAPISGFIVQKNISNSTAIRADNGGNLFTISDLKNVWVQANVFESSISKVHLGEEVRVTTLSYPGRVFKGKIDKIMNVLDPASKVMKMRVVLQNDDYALKPQMFASVSVTNQQSQQALCVPASALIFDHNQYFILEYKNNSEILIRNVELLSTVGDKAFIAAGIEEGKKVIATQALLIYGAINS